MGHPWGEREVGVLADLKSEPLTEHNVMTMHATNNRAFVLVIFAPTILQLACLLCATHGHSQKLTPQKNHPTARVPPLCYALPQSGTPKENHPTARVPPLCSCMQLGTHGLFGVCSCMPLGTHGLIGVCSCMQLGTHSLIGGCSCLQLGTKWVQFLK